VRPCVVVQKNFPTEVHCGQHVWCQNLISVSGGAKVAVNVHQLRFSAYDMGHPTSSHFFRRNCRLKDTIPCETLIPASLDRCTAISFLQHESWFIAELDSPPVYQVQVPYSVAPSDPLLVDADVSVLCQSKDVWRVSRFHGDGFWLCADICLKPGTFDAVFLSVTVRNSQVQYPDVAILGCWCVRPVLQANGGHNIYLFWSDVIWTLWTLIW
jgi:hypothetical protein